MGGGERAYKVGALDFASLVFNLVKSVAHPKVGWEHADLTFPQFLGEIENYVLVKEDHLQTLLAQSNFMDERGQFFHPSLSFYQLSCKILGPNKKFNRKYNLICEIKDGKSNDHS